MIRYELVAFPGCTVAGLSAVPGAVTVDAATGARWLHHAPGRWLEWQPEGDERPWAPSVLANEAMAAGTAAGFEVGGKYQRFAFEAESGRAVLATTVNLDAVLGGGRECAAVPLFDCPAILLRVANGFFVWVTTSHVADFTAAAERAQDICAKL